MSQAVSDQPPPSDVPPGAGPGQALPPGSVAVPAGEVFAIASEYFEAGRLDAAERMLRHMLAARPEQPEPVHLLGLIEHKRGHGEAAAALVERAIAAGGRRPVHYRNLSEIYRLLARLDPALTAARRAVSLDPADALGLFNLAMVLYDRLEVKAATSAARAALEIKPNLPQAHMKLGQSLLLQGEFAEGWEEYEWRYQIPGAAPLMPKTDRPHWDGRPLGEGERLLLIADQGYGDVIQFARYISWVQARTREVVLACSRELLSTIDRIVPGLPAFHRWEACPSFVAYCPLSGLPRLAGTRLETIPAPIPYLKAESTLAAAWREKLAARVTPGFRRLGITWAGRPTHNNDINRTIRLETLAPVFDIANVALISLQKGPAAAELGGYRGSAPLINLDPEINSFDDTAAIVENLDLVLCVDTSLGHLAGALGKPVWLMLPHAPDWRWLLGRSDTPWYPTMRLFRCPGPRRWDLLLPQVAEAVRAWAQSPDWAPGFAGP
ncbi:MAG: glycosyltransferase family protein [Rhodospirillales bacterium]|nr:glycosyltransferase family protein [Rhodospirillales bacterium]